MGIGVIQLIMLLIIPVTLGLTLWGAYRVVQRAGYSGGWAFILPMFAVLTRTRRRAS